MKEFILEIKLNLKKQVHVIEIKIKVVNKEAL